MSDTVERVDWRDLPPVAEPIERPATASVTFLKHANACLRAAYLHARYRGGAGSHDMGRGSALHRVTERGTLIMLEQGESQLPPEVAKDLADEAIADPDLQVPFEEHDYLRMCAWRWAEQTTIDPANVVAVETLFTLKLGDWTVRGRIDLASIDGDVASIIDYKSGRNLPTQDDVAVKLDDGRLAAKQLQLVLYGLLLALGTPEGAPGPVGERVQWFNLALVFPGIRMPDGGMGRRDTVLSRGELLEYRASLEALLSRVGHAFASGKWQPVPSSHCSSECPARWECPLPPALRDEWITVNSREDAQAAAVRWLFLTEQATAVRAELKDWAQFDGPIRFGKDLVLEFRAEESASVKDWDLLESAIERAREWGEPVDVAAHQKTRRSTKFVKRRLTASELAEEGGVSDGGSNGSRDGDDASAG